ncbi:MAG: LptF/LptG family permease [Deltaproteobacteria bacterium]|jgi:lipopolysaccharide export system permease protein|nr:LptF/LptG family permease [Deltaproteobacteria bacterium]
MISVIDRYMAGLFFRHLGLCLAGFLALFLTVDFVEKISEFVSHNIPLKSVLTYFLAQIPNVLVLLIPVATLASILISLVLLSRNSEIVAFKGSGVSLYRLSAPFVVIGVGLSLFVFLLNNLLTPMTQRVVNEIWEGQVRNRRAEASALTVEDVWFKELRLLTHLGSYKESSGEALSISLLVLDENFNLSRRMEAAKGLFSPEGLTLIEAQEKIYHYGEDGQRSFQLVRSDTLTLPDWPMPPKGLGRHGVANSDELSVMGLREVVARLYAEGFYPIRQLVDFQFKFSRPFIPLIMVLVGLPIGFWREKGGSVALGLVIGLTISFVYLISLELSRSVGYTGLLPPFLAAWAPNCFFGLIGLYLFTYVRQ